MTDKSVWLYFSAALCVVIAVTLGILPRDWGNQWRTYALALCVYGGFAVFLSAVAARNGLVGVGVVIAGLLVALSFFSLVGKVASGCLGGFQLAFVLLLLGTVGILVYNDLLLLLHSGNPNPLLCGLLMCIGLLEILLSLVMLPIP